MRKNIEKIINTALAGIGTAMGIAIIVLGILDTEIAVNTYITMLGIATAALGLFALNSISSKNTSTQNESSNQPT